MIFAHDKGRLCNNVLQYGHVYAWGREHGRQTMSMRFAYKYRYFRLCHTARHNVLLYVVAKYAAKWGLLPVAEFREPEPSAVGRSTSPNIPDSTGSAPEQLLLSHKHVVAEGWYARWYDLFLKYKREIIDIFAFDERVKVRPDRLMSSLPEADLRLGVHVRRGDYRTFFDGRFFYTDEQYVSLIRQFLTLHPGRRVQVFVCGNDRTLNRDAYRELGVKSEELGVKSEELGVRSEELGVSHAAVVDVSFPCGNPGEDLYLLSQCDYLIGPPSTFSLVASMYRDVPLCWVEDVEQPLEFKTFDYLFRHIM